MKGVSVYVSVGKWAGLSLQFCHPTWFRLVLGWIAISLVGYDVDYFIGSVARKHSTTDSKED